MAYPRSTSHSGNYVGIGLEATKGTAVAPTLFVPYRSAVGLDHGMSGEDVFEAGSGPYVNRKMKTNHDPSGDFGLGCRPSTASKLAAYFLGADSISGTGPYTHVLTPDENTRRWLTIDQAAGADGDIIERFVDAVIKSLTFSVNGNVDLMAQVSWFALAPAWQATAATPTYESGINGSTPGANFRASDATYTIDGAAETNVKSFEVALEWKYDEDIRLSRITRSEALKLQLSGTVKCVQLLNSTATRDAYRAINYGSAAATAAAADFIGSGDFLALFDNGLTTTNERELSINCPEIDWTMATYTALDPSGQTMYVEREGSIKKVSGTVFTTITAKTGDSAAYVS